MNTLSAVRTQALLLPPAEREELAQDLIESLDLQSEPLTVEPEYEQELQRRIASVANGTAKLTDADTFLKELRSRARGADQE